MWKETNVGRGKLLVFSGLDGAGKSTQINLLLECLRAEGEKPIYMWTRGGYTPTFNALKTLLRRLFRGRVMPLPGHNPQRTQAFSRPQIRRLWLQSALLDLMWVYGVWVRWWLWRGKTVVCDRYLWDTLVDFRLNFSQECVERWWLWQLLDRITPSPSVAFLLLIPAEESVRRSDMKGEPFRDPPDVLEQRLAQYQALAQQAGHWYVLDGQSDIDDLFDQIQEVVGVLAQPDLSLST